MRIDEALFRNQCGLCGCRLGPGEGCLMLVRDSSAIHDHQAKLDGQRLVLACGNEHLAALRERYLHRPFVEAEPWAGKIHQSQHDHPGGLSQEELVRATGLDTRQIQQALAWQEAHAGSPRGQAHT